MSRPGIHNRVLSIRKWRYVLWHLDVYIWFTSVCFSRFSMFPFATSSPYLNEMHVYAVQRCDVVRNLTAAFQILQVMPPLLDILTVIILVCFLLASFGHYLFAELEPLLSTLGGAMSGMFTAPSWFCNLPGCCPNHFQIVCLYFEYDMFRIRCCILLWDKLVFYFSFSFWHASA